MFAVPAGPVHFALEDLRQPQVRQPNVPCSFETFRKRIRRLVHFATIIPKIQSNVYRAMYTEHAD